MNKNQNVKKFAKKLSVYTSLPCNKIQWIACVQVLHAKKFLHTTFLLKFGFCEC